MQVNWMCNLTVDIYCNQLNDIVEIHFDPIGALAGGQEISLEAVLIFG